MTIIAEELEELVVEAAMQRLDGPRLAARRAKAADVVEDGTAVALAADEAKLLELSDDYADNRITRAEWLRQRERVQHRIDAAHRKLAQRADVDVLDGLTGGAARELWPKVGLDRQRAILGAVIAKVTVAPARRGLPRFDESRVDIEWRA